MKFETNTPRFRIAISVCFVWILVFGYFGYQEYKAVPDYSLSELYRDDASECYSQKMQFGQNAEFRYRDATTTEVDECFSDVRKLHRRYEQDENQRVLIESAKWVALPPFALLLISLFWTTIIKTVAIIFRRYAGWIKGTGEPRAG
jgi:hypothetical protein